MKALFFVLVTFLVFVNGCLGIKEAKLVPSLADDFEACKEEFTPLIPDRVTLRFNPQREVWMLRKLKFKDGHENAANVDFRKGIGSDQDQNFYYAYTQYTGVGEAGYGKKEAGKERLTSMKFKLRAIPQTLTSDGMEMDFEIIEPVITWCDWYN
ncbi:MAG: hypothetical protein KKD39_02085 [Candidatus Altiarchaeota archaeon]|nr:hypothetical protein [Candidatus Altiarchaeota archaeon]